MQLLKKERMMIIDFSLYTRRLKAMAGAVMLPAALLLTGCGNSSQKNVQPEAEDSESEAPAEDE